MNHESIEPIALIGLTVAVVHIIGLFFSIACRVECREHGVIGKWEFYLLTLLLVTALTLIPIILAI